MELQIERLNIEKEVFEERQLQNVREDILKVYLIGLVITIRRVYLS